MRAGEWEKPSGSKTGAAASASCLILQKGISGEEVVVSVFSTLAVGTVVNSQVMPPLSFSVLET